MSIKSAWVCAAILLSGATAAAQDTPKQNDTAPARIVWNDYPSLRAGVFRLDAHVKYQGDFRETEQDLSDAGHEYQTRMRRVGISGRITNRIQFEVDREMRKVLPWRNAYVNVEIEPALQVRAGRFKMPFSYDQLTGITKLDFAYRSFVGDTIAPARDTGVMAHGALLGQTLGYQAGLFRHDGDNARVRQVMLSASGTPLPDSERSFAARITLEPLRHAGPEDLRRLYLGVAVTSSHVPEGRHSLQGESLLGAAFADRVYVLGERRRLGAEAIWMPGPFSVKSEYARATEERQRQGAGGEDLSDFVASAWYVSGTWAITGERKTANVEPLRPAFDKGFGAIEVGARYERIRFASGLDRGAPSPAPRADPYRPNADRVLTLGANWYLNKWSKLVLNGIREAFDDPERTAVPGRTAVWAAILRLQFVM